jgi:dGTPase
LCQRSSPSCQSGNPVAKGGRGVQYADAWKQIVSAERLRPTRVTSQSEHDARTKFENDFDRVVFSSSFRRLRNKAQVFSLEPHDFVRTRLTHSIEVSTIGRSLGEGAAKGLVDKYADLREFLVPRDVGTIVATACLLHDIGNPPFGHSGEKAIGFWFAENNDSGKRLKLSGQEATDLTMFEGNAQSFRIATRLQWTGQDFGMNLTSATLSALIKYPCASNQVKSDGPKSLKKFGYFKADADTFQQVRKRTGLDKHRRNPLTYLMEAADDIAYATGDIEDVLKKGFLDYETVRESLHTATTNESKECVEKYLEEPYHVDLKGVAKRERQQLAVQRFCQMAIRLMTQSAIAAFLKKFDTMMSGTFDDDLVGVMSMSDLCAVLKEIMKQHVYSHVEIAHREQTARSVIGGLLSAILDELQDRRDGPLAKSTYREAPKHREEPDILTTDNYRIALRATDHVSGMTDGYALAQYQRIFGMRPT